VNSPNNAQETFLECGALTKTALIGVILTYVNGDGWKYKYKYYSYEHLL